MKTLQERLKEETTELHEKAEAHPLMKSFIEGKYKKEHLFQYLVNLRPLYESVEQRLIIKQIHKNFDLCRSRLVSKDIAMLYKEGIVNEDNILMIPFEDIHNYTSKRFDVILLTAVSAINETNSNNMSLYFYTFIKKIFYSC
jgi:heme oxygenase